MKPDNTQETIYVGLDTGLPPYLPYPRFLLKMDISQTAKLLYALLLDRTTLSQRNGWQDDQGRTFIVYPIAEIAEMLDKGQTAIKAALNELDAAGLLERKRAGFSAANRLYVKLPPLVRISDPMTVGKPTPNNLTINNLIENQTMGVSGEPHKPFGRYENVFLTEAEYAELKAEFPDRLERLIEEMSRYLAANGRTYQNYAAALRIWAENDKKDAPKQGVPDYTCKEGESL
ncbi:replication initiator protein A [Faecalicoccus sp. LCP19S3_E3]|uniref:replication initiator protein A n=1 Tax=unclassified Faecalicoccus TaxID=2643311 RepID=UPI003F8E9B70